jgi:2-keto-4-pentenoate hydratase/2-oxohepta-3-ene-1,7-dioic acid hydratase in catechol pathway
MKLCTFEVRTQIGKIHRLGAVLREGIVDLNFACARCLSERGEVQPQRVANAVLPDNMLEYLQGGAGTSRYARETLEFLTGKLSPPPEGVNGETLLYAKTDVRLLAPIPNPASLRDFYAFENHVKKGFEKRGEPMPQEWYEIPVYYKSGHHNIIGHEQDVHWPSFTERFDYELELAAIIGRQGRNIKKDDARQYIAGFTIMNDFSARDIQHKEMKVRLGPAKGKDWCTSLGPWLVTPDEIADPYNLKMAARVNGELWSTGSSQSMHWKFEQMIEFLSQDDEIRPGDVLGSGTVGGGCGLELDRWIKSGDVMELAVEGIGVLRNRVVKP